MIGLATAAILTLPLTAAQVAAADPIILCNMTGYAQGSPLSEVVMADDRVFVGIGYETGGGEFVTLREPGRFAQTWARLAGDLVSLQSDLPNPPTGTRFHMIRVTFADHSIAQWIGLDEGSGVQNAMTQFGMNEERVFFDHTMTPVEADHWIFTNPCGGPP